MENLFNLSFSSNFSLAPTGALSLLERAAMLPLVNPKRANFPTLRTAPMTTAAAAGHRTIVVVNVAVVRASGDDAPFSIPSHSRSSLYFGALLSEYSPCSGRELRKRPLSSDFFVTRLACRGYELIGFVLLTLRSDTSKTC